MIFPIWKLNKHNSIFANSAKGKYIKFMVSFLTPVGGDQTNIDLAYSNLHMVSHDVTLWMIPNEKATLPPQSTGQIIIR